MPEAAHVHSMPSIGRRPLAMMALLTLSLLEAHGAFAQPRQGSKPTASGGDDMEAVILFRGSRPEVTPSIVVWRKNPRVVDDRRWPSAGVVHPTAPAVATPVAPKLGAGTGAVQAVAAASRTRTAVESRSADAIETAIRDASRKFGVDAALVRAVIHVESAFDPKAVSSKGARGLMQLMPATAQRFGVTDVENPEQNVHAGTRYLRLLLDLFEGDLRLALAAYNAGEGAVIRYSRRVPPFAETQGYVRLVLERYRQLRG
jgi:membrane-bound lytic murein transglycosylase B